MSEIKPEHLEKHIGKDIDTTSFDFDDLAHWLNWVQQYGITVLMPGELYWIKRNVAAFPKFKEWHAMSACRCYAVYESIANPNTFDISFVTIKNGHTIKKYLVPTLEAAKQFCQQLENEARST